MAVGQAQRRVDTWFVRNALPMKSGIRVIFGLIWLIDGSFKFQAGFAAQFSVGASGVPDWLSGWYSFWGNIVNPDPSPWVYGIGAIEILLGLALVFGFLQKVAASGGFVLSLFIWAVPETFGAPYGPSSTDIGTGVVYAIAFLLLLTLDAVYGTDRWSLDAWIERRYPAWARWSSIRRGAVGETAGSGSNST